jgi:hypothetical protein
MADNVAITAGAGTTIGTDERTIASTSVQIQRVDEQGGQSITADDVSVSTTAASAIAARDTRKNVTILASPANTDVVYVGDTTVDAATPANGFRLDPGAAITLCTTKAVWADAASGTQTIYYVEVYD